MMNAMKNILATTPALSLPAADASVKGKQLLRGRTRARVETVTADLEAARLAFAQAEQLLGEHMIDEGVDVVEVTAEMKRAEDRVRALESALAVASQKDDAAQAELKRAETEARRDVLREKLVQLTGVGRTIDEIQDHLKRVVHDELAPLMNEVRGLGYDEVNQQLNTASLSFKPRHLETCRPMPGCATGESWFLRPEPWSASLPQPDLADRVKL